MKDESNSIDNIHLAALADFEDNPRALIRLCRAYIEARIHYIAERDLLRAEEDARFDSAPESDS